MSSASHGTNKFNYNLTDYEKGVYFLRMTSNKGSLNYKIVIR